MTDIRLLALAETPKDGKEIIDWRPFGQKTLGEIVNNYNVKCLRAHEKFGWSPQNISKIMDKIDIVRYDLNGLQNLGSKDFETITIIFADLDAVQGKSVKLGWVRNYMGSWPKKYYLIQVSKTSGSQSLMQDFTGATIWPYPIDPPNLLSREEEFVKFLDIYFCGIVGRAPSEGINLSQGVGIEGKSTDDYIDAILEVKEEVRHVAITKNMSKEDTSSLALLAVQQELALQNVSSQIQIKRNQQIVLDEIRVPVSQIAIHPSQKPDFTPRVLLEVHPTQSLNRLSDQHRSILQKMGIKNKTYISVIANTSDTQNLINNLGDSIKVSKISANLPAFKINI